MQKSNTPRKQGHGHPARLVEAISWKLMPHSDILRDA